MLRLGMTAWSRARSSCVTQFSAIIGLVAEHAFRWLHSADQALSDRTIVRFASGQQDGDQAPFSICECMDLRVAPSARAANSLFCSPFSARAERCALTWVESIICISTDRPLPASSRNRFSQRPRRPQRTKRKRSRLCPTASGGQSHQRHRLNHWHWTDGGLTYSCRLPKKGPISSATANGEK